MSNQDITVFAETTFRNQYKKFGIKTDDRRRHMYVIGKTGVGKSTVLENLIIEDIRAGKGVAVVDPHGETVEKVMRYIPDNRVEDVIYFNPSDTEHPIAFNIVEHVEPHLRHLVASGLIGVFQKLWADSWGPRLEYILRNAILAVLDYPGSTLLSVTRMLADKQFRKKVIESIQDPVVKAFWVKEFASYADKFASEAVAPIQNKVGQFLSSSLIRNIVGQTKSSIDIRDAMDNKKILLMNFSKGRIGEDNAALLGAMMITKIQLAAMSRVDIPENDRNDFYLYVDEFQNFATESFANILSEARKYHLNLIMAHQYIEQLDEKVASAVFGNVGTLVVFRVGATDAESLVKEFTPAFTEEDLVNLPKYNFCLKLMIDGVASDPFSARGLPPLPKEELTGNESVVINLTRQKYAADRETVESLIANWHDEDFTPARPTPAAIAGTIVGSGTAHVVGDQSKTTNTATYNAPSSQVERRASPGSQSGFEIDCSSCGKKTRITFEPDGVRPVYCKECLVKSKDERKNQMESRRQAKEAELARLNQTPAMPARATNQSIPAKVTKEVLPARPRPQAPANQIVRNTQVQSQRSTVTRVDTVESKDRNVTMKSSENSRSSVSSVTMSQPRPRPEAFQKANHVQENTVRQVNTRQEVYKAVAPVVKLETVAPEPTMPSLSLADLGKKPAVDFKGREIKPQEARPPKIVETDEGEEVTLYEG